MNLYRYIAFIIATLAAAAVGASDDTDAQDVLDCVINPSVVADLGSGSPGIISAVHVDRGDAIRSGDLLAELDSGVEQAAMELARSRADKQTEVQLRRVNAAFGRRQLQRSEDLFQRKVVSSNDIDERKTEADLARIELRQALDNRELAALEFERARQVVERRRIQSPIDGVVMERFKTVGEYVDEQPVLRVAQLDPLHVEVFVPVERLGEVLPGMQADVWSDVATDSEWRATVSRVDPVSDIASGTYGVRLVLPNPGHGVPAGLRCRLRFGELAAVPPPDPTLEPEWAASPTSESPSTESPSTELPSMDPSDPAPFRLVRPEAGATGTSDATGDVPVPDGAQTDLSATPGTDDPGPRSSVTAGCLRAGPFAERATATALFDRLAALDLDVRLVVEEHVETGGFSVFSPLMEGRASADAIVEILRRHGIEDFVVHRHAGDYRVAMGAYRTAEAARRRVAQLAAIGVEAERAAWSRTAQRYAVVIHEGAGVHARVDALRTEAGVDIAPAVGCDQVASR